MVNRVSQFVGFLLLFYFLARYILGLVSQSDTNACDTKSPAHLHLTSVLAEAILGLLKAYSKYLALFLFLGNI